jgi:uncharacterized protein
VMEPTLDAAIARIFGGPAAPVPPASQSTSATPAGEPAAPAPSSAPPPLTALATAAQRHYEQAIQAQRAGDWAKYGEEIRALGDALKQLQAAP